MRAVLIGACLLVAGCGNYVGWFAAGVLVGTQLDSDEIVVNVEHEHDDTNGAGTSDPANGLDDGGSPPDDRPPEGRPPHGPPGRNENGDDADGTTGPGHSEDDPGDDDPDADPDDGDDDGDNDDSEERVTICHHPGCPELPRLELESQGRTIVLGSDRAAEAHLAHGDTLGACE